MRKRPGASMLQTLFDCMQCRQKTVEVKAKCQTCTLWWCPACLLNRYGEEVAKVGLVLASAPAVFMVHLAFICCHANMFACNVFTLCCTVNFEGAGCIRAGQPSGRLELPSMQGHLQLQQLQKGLYEAMVTTMCMSLRALTFQLPMPASYYLLSSQHTIAFMYGNTYSQI